MRATSTGRRRALGALAGLPLAACSAPTAVPTPPDPLPVASPEHSAGGVLLFLVPGLGLEDVVLGAGEGHLPQMSRMLDAGVLIEALSPDDDALYSLAEMGHALIAEGSFTVVEPACRRWDLGLGATSAEECPLPPTSEAALEHWLQSLEGAVGALEGTEAAAVPPPRLLVPLDGLLTLETRFLLVDPLQEGYSAESALAYAEVRQTALRGLDAAVGRVLRRLDLTSWSVLVASTGEAWAVHSRLDPAELSAPVTVLPGAALLEGDAGLSLPEDDAWQSVRLGQDPQGQGKVRLLAPPGYAFVGATEELPRAVPRPSGFVLGVGNGLARGATVKNMAPEWAGDLLAKLGGAAGQDSAAGSS